MTKKVVTHLLLILSVLSLFIISCGKVRHQPGSVSENMAPSFVPKDTTWKTLTLREKIGQTMIIVSRFYDHEKFEGGTLDAFFQRYPVGGFYVPDWYYVYLAPKDSSLDYYIKESIKEYFP